MVAQFAHLAVMAYLKQTLGLEVRLEPVDSLGAWWYFLFWGWVALFLLAGLSHLSRGPLPKKEAALSFALVLVLPVLHHLSM
jgi:cbb3-type cytochrome oxidase subunit 1